ncbi:MAG: T9SS type A sorting domain-containing protein [Prevotella sp.]|nr:T9SS type A sorting domain-containing protein [Prevotella sp.]
MQTTNIRLWLLSLLLLTVSGLRAAEDEVLLRVSLMDGSEVLFSLEEKPEVTFDDESVFIQSTASSATYQIDHVVEMNFVEKDPVVTKKEEMPDVSAKILFRILGDLVKVVGNNLSSEISVFTADGRLVEVPVDYSNNEINVRLGSLPRGIYIIKTNQQSFKFIRK